MQKNNNIKPRSNRVARSMHAHLVIAIALGGLIYILAVTGTLSVFNRELQRWEQPSVSEMHSISAVSAEMAAKAVFESEEVPSKHLYINFPQQDLPRTVITTDTNAYFANEDGSIGEKEHFPWTQFLLDLHYYLHLPQVLGLTIVGALGAFLLAMSLSGFIAHPRIFRDAFTFRRGEGLLPIADLHNRLSVWTAPFHISNALTGALLGLASVFAFSIATVNFDGDLEKVFPPVFGEEPPELEGDAPIADIATPIKFMAAEFPGQEPTFFILHDPATAGQHVSIVAKHADRLIFGDYYNFNAQGDYQGNVGISDGTLGQQLIGSVYNVHFGNWGGLPVKVAYSIFGIVLSIIIASGLRIYFSRRRQKGAAMPKLESAWEAVVWGTPFSLLLCLLLAVSAGYEGLSLVAVFWLVMCATIVVSAILADAQKVRLGLRYLSSACLILTLLSHLIRHSEAVFTQAMYPVSLLAIIFSVILLIPAFRKPKISQPNLSTNIPS